MSQKLSWFHFNWKQEKFLILAFLVVALVALPFWPAHAQSFNPFQWLGDITGGMATAIITTALNIPLFFANAFLGIAATLLGWVISPSFVSVPYTTLDNPIINVGWPLTRDLANMGFVIILLFIGLGTALRLGEYQVQKTLPLLIMVSLLINFTPVLLGIIVDASNIIMNFFLDGLTGGETFQRIYAQQFAIFQNAWGGWNSGFNATPFAQTAVLAVFGFVAGIMLFIFAALFITRYIAIWLLVIFSPLAFMAYVLPATRGMWKMWWNQFLQWCFIGVFASFFLYLSEQMISKVTTPASSGGIVFNTAGGAMPGTFLDVFLPYIVVIGFLIIGFIMSTSVSAMGARETISAVKGGKVWLQTRRPVQLAQGKLASGTAASLAKIASAGERLEKAPLAGALGMGKLAGWAMRTPHTLASPGLIEYAAGKRKFGIPKGWDQMSLQEKDRYVSSQGLAQDRLVLYSKMKSEGVLQIAGPALRDKALADAGKLANDVRLKKEVGDVLDAFPDKITEKVKIDFELSTVPQAQKQAKRDEIQKELDEIISEHGVSRDEAAGIYHAKRFKAKDIPGIAKGSITHPVGRIASQYMSQSHFQRLVEDFDKPTVENALNERGGINTIVNSEEDFEDLYLKNPRLVNWLITNPAGRALNWSGTRFVPGNNFDNFKRNTDLPGINIVGNLPNRNDRQRLLNYQRAYQRAAALEQERLRLIQAGADRADIDRVVNQMQRIVSDMGLVENDINTQGNQDLRQALQNLQNLQAP